MKNPLEHIIEKLSGTPPQKGHLHTFINPYSYQIIRKHERIIKKFDTFYCDGSGLVLLLGVIRIAIRRQSFDMTSLAPQIFKNSAQKKESIYIVGSTSESIGTFIQTIKGLYPEVSIIGFRHGYFQSSEERLNSIKSICEARPDIVITGMGTPLQEQFLLDLREAGWSGTGYTCGGFIHQTASHGANYYPPIMNKLNLRWLYRIYDEPKLLRRYAISYPIAIGLFLWDALQLALRKRRTQS